MKAIVLLSGGLDSATLLYFARNRGYRCFCLTFDYGQRHKREIESAKKIAKQAGCKLQIINFDLPWKGSSLLDTRIKVPQPAYPLTRLPANPDLIPTTYVPCRNTIFLSFAASYAEAIGAGAIFIGANSIDYSGYPDCRPKYIKAMQNVFLLGTKAGAEGKPIKLISPFIRKTKAQIIRLGKKLNVPYELTWSCYLGKSLPCNRCDSCILRAKGFKEAGIPDPLIV